MDVSFLKLGTPAARQLAAGVFSGELMGAESITVEPGDIAMLGDDIIEHLKHFSASERVAIALYVLSDAVAEIRPADKRGATDLANRAIFVGRRRI